MTNAIIRCAGLLACMIVMDRGLACSIEDSDEPITPGLYSISSETQVFYNLLARSDAIAGEISLNKLMSEKDEYEEYDDPQEYQDLKVHKLYVDHRKIKPKVAMVSTPSLTARLVSPSLEIT